MNEGFALLLRIIPFAVVGICIGLICLAIASGDIVNFMKQALPALGGLFIILLLSLAMA